MSIFESISNGFRAISDPFIGQGNSEENRMIREEKAKIKKLTQQIEEQYSILGKTYYGVKAEAEGLEPDEAAAQLEIVEAEAVVGEAAIETAGPSDLSEETASEEVPAEEASSEDVPSEEVQFEEVPSEEACPEVSACEEKGSEDPTVSEIRKKISELLIERKECKKRISEVEESIRIRKEEEAAERETAG